MAYLKKSKNKVGKIYYSSQVQNYGVWKNPLSISLKTSDYKEAMRRHQEVEDKEKALKRGMQFTWSWEEGNRGRTRIIAKDISMLINEWLDIKKINVRERTYDRYEDSMNRFVEVIGKTCPPKAITNKTIEQFKRYYKGRHTEGGININLRGIKCLLIWCLEEGHIDKMPKIEMMQVNKSKPKTLNEGQWKAIMRCDTLTDWWKNVFRVYKQTGIRLSEGILGELVGNFLIVSAEDSKTKMEREILLTDNQVSIIHKIHIARDEHFARGSQLCTFKNKFSRQFSRISMKLNIEGVSFHSLRHTFAVRRYLETRDIYQVCKELGHTSIKTTEIYTQFSFARLEQDYPSLVLRLEREGKKDKSDTQIVDTHSYQFLNSPLKN